MSGTLHIIAPGQPWRTEPYAGKRPTLEQLQKAVGGMIEPVKTRYHGRVREAYVNEEGLVYNLPFNSVASVMVREFGYDGIVGPLVVIVPTPKVKK